MVPCTKWNFTIFRTNIDDGSTNNWIETKLVILAGASVDGTKAKDKVIRPGGEALVFPWMGSVMSSDHIYRGSAAAMSFAEECDDVPSGDHEQPMLKVNWNDEPFHRHTTWRHFLTFQQNGLVFDCAQDWAYSLNKPYYLILYLLLGPALP